MKIVIPGIPVPKARHRDGIRKGKRVKYDPQEQEKNNASAYMQNQIQKSLENKNREYAAETQELAKSTAFIMHCTFYLPIPNNDNCAVRNAKLWGFIPHNIKPDASNLLKFYEDAANNVLYRDDCMIVDARAVKKWSDKPRTEIMITPMNNKDKQQQDILSLVSPEEARELVKLFFKLPLCFIDPDYFDYEKERRLDLHDLSMILSEMADKFGDKLNKISKKCPGYWQKKQEVIDEKR